MQAVNFSAPVIAISDFDHREIVENRLQVYSEKREFKHDSFAEDTGSGLSATPKYLLPKYFYDEKGSHLFEEITRTADYYPTRTEKQILEDNTAQLVKTCAGVGTVVELGSGSSEKTKLILSEFSRNREYLTYMPIDVSDFLVKSSRKLIEYYDNLDITGIVSDYERGLGLVQQINDQPKLIIFLGSSIGNFNREEILDFFFTISNEMTAEDYLLIGFDLVKDRDILQRAYNDSEGVTQDFNLNILRRINRELGANFDLSQFKHRAIFNETLKRVEMHLVSLKEQTVTLPALKKTVEFSPSESIHTENSHKFTDETMTAYAQKTGLSTVHNWKDVRSFFSLTLFRLS